MSLCEPGFDNIWFPFTYKGDLVRQPPIVIERGQGVYLYDTNGKQYMDAIGSWWVSTLGHCNPAIMAAIKSQTEKLDHVMMAGFVSPPAVKLSGLLSQMLPAELNHFFFSDDGSTAVEAGLKMAIQYRHLRKENRNRFVALGGAYHGDTLGAMAVGGIPSYHDIFHNAFGSALFTDPPYCYKCPCGKKPDSCNAQCMDSMETIFKKHGQTIAACIVEPMIQGAAGMRVYPAKVLRRIYDLTRKHDILLIADEVATGFGRTGKMFACEHAGIVPDIMCLAKGLTGGTVPLAVTVVKDFIYNEFCGDYGSDRIFNHGHSFTGNPIAASAACAAMSFMIDNNIPESISPLIDDFSKRLQGFRQFDIVGDVRSIGMMGALELDSSHPLVSDPGKRMPHRICQAALKRGLIIRPLGNVIYFVPALTVTPAQTEEMFSLCEAAITDVLKDANTDS